MARLSYRWAAVGAVLAISGTACASGKGDDDAHSAAQVTYTRVAQLEPVHVSGDVFADMEESSTSAAPHALGEVTRGGKRIIAYVQGGSCGVMVVDAADVRHASLNLRSAWPTTGSEGSSDYPAGPYSSARGAGSGTPGERASIACSSNAMIIRYQAPDAGPAVRPVGHVTVREESDPRTTQLVVGSDAARSEILGQLEQ
ncbi:hypothetical protein ABT160_45855 [Streptomyces sp. NPDC001941]|uniref:hypothetical protein n=1 Tax=Streptomyces sp. NPDC001941 TaxID=3154659 RepID=UPI0033214493